MTPESLVVAPTAQSPEVWKSLSQWLPPRDADKDFWWNLCGHNLAVMLEAGDYTLSKQYDALIFFYHWVVPYMGPAPRPDGKVRWKTVLGVEGSPIDYSWKWNTSKSKPDVRFTIEAIGPYTGTTKDPLNQQAMREMLHHISKIVPTFNSELADHFFATLFDHDISKYNQEVEAGAAFGTSCLNATQFLPEGVSMKSYFICRRLGQAGPLAPLSHWEEAFAKLDPSSPARTAIHDFLEAHTDRAMVPTSVAVDNVAPAESRLKFYFQTASSSFQSVRETMTLDGRIKVPEKRLQQLRSLISAVVGVEDDYPEDKQVLPTVQKGDEISYLPTGVNGFAYYFDIAPGSQLPDVKLYVPMHYYGHDDLSLANALTSWMKSNDRGQYCDRYMAMLERIAYHRRLDSRKGLQSYVSCMIKKDDLDITTYLDPEAFHRVQTAAIQSGITAKNGS